MTVFDKTESLLEVSTSASIVTPLYGGAIFERNSGREKVQFEKNGNLKTPLCFVLLWPGGARINRRRGPRARVSKAP